MANITTNIDKKLGIATIYFNPTKFDPALGEEQKNISTKLSSLAIRGMIVNFETRNFRDGIVWIYFNPAHHLSKPEEAIDFIKEAINRHSQED